MKIFLILIGKTDKSYFKAAFDEYQKRIKKYIPYELIEIPDVKNAKNLSPEEQKTKEGELILKKLPEGPVFLLDENGKDFTSPELAKFLQTKMNHGLKNISFVIGGPYGFSKEVYKKASSKIALSRLTFSHQMVRIIFAEQLYRAFTIINREPYHHE